MLRWKGRRRKRERVARRVWRTEAREWEGREGPRVRGKTTAGRAVEMGEADMLVGAQEVLALLPVS